MREPSLRGILRTVAGLSQELSTADSPALLQKNEHTLKLLNNLVALCTASSAIKRAEELKHFVKFMEPTSELAAAVELLFGPGRQLDVELLVLQVITMC